MNIFFKKLYITVALASLVFTGGAFAQQGVLASEPISNLELSAGPPVSFKFNVSGTQEDTSLEVYLEGENISGSQSNLIVIPPEILSWNSNQGTVIINLLDSEGPYSYSIGLNPAGVTSVLSDSGSWHSHFVVRSYLDDQYSDILQRISIAQLFGVDSESESESNNNDSPDGDEVDVITLSEPFSQSGLVVGSSGETFLSTLTTGSVPGVQLQLVLLGVDSAGNDASRVINPTQALYWIDGQQSSITLFGTLVLEDTDDGGSQMRDIIDGSVYNTIGVNVLPQNSSVQQSVQLLSISTLVESGFNADTQVSTDSQTTNTNTSGTANLTTNQPPLSRLVLQPNPFIADSIVGLVQNNYSGRTINIDLVTASNNKLRVSTNNTIDWENGNSFAFALPENIQVNSEEGTVVGTDGTQYTNVAISASSQGGQSTDVLQSYIAADIIAAAGITSTDGTFTPEFLERTLNFPGWVDAEYRSFIAEDGTTKYYPFLRSYRGVEREPEDASLYLILENVSDGGLVQLAEYEAAGRSARITWPPCVVTDFLEGGSCTVPTDTFLVPGTSYAAYLSDRENGPEVSFGDSQSSYVGFDPVPGNIPEVSITNVVVNSTSDSFESFSVSGVNQSGNILDLQWFATTPSGNEDIFLGNQEGVDPGPFQFEQSNTFQADAGTYIVRALNNDIEVARRSTIFGSSSGNNGSSTSTSTIQQPSFWSVDTGLLPECGYSLSDQGRSCGFNDFIVLINNIIKYIIVLIIPIMAIVFAYAGFLFLTSGGDSAKRTKAKKAMTSAIIGIVIILSAWLIVRTIVRALGVDENSTTYYLGD